MVTKAGFIGLGNLGRAVARRLISQGVELVVWNRTKSKAGDLAAVWKQKPATVSPVRELYSQAVTQNLQDHDFSVI